VIAQPSVAANKRAARLMERDADRQYRLNGRQTFETVPG
jgi:hypothetical protein